MTTSVHVARHGALYQVTLDRPKANAVDAATSRALYVAFRAFQDDPEARVAILTGAGDRFFCAGWDLKAAAEGEGGGVQRLPRRIAPALAMELLLTGRRVGAEEALRLGLVNRVAPLGSLMSAAREFAASIAAKAPLATRAAKALARAGEGLSVEETFASMRSGRVADYDAMLASEDAQEGPRAFAEKRPPVWTGR